MSIAVTNLTQNLDSVVDKLILSMCNINILNVGGMLDPRSVGESVCYQEIASSLERRSQTSWPVSLLTSTFPYRRRSSR